MVKQPSPAFHLDGAKLLLTLILSRCSISLAGIASPPCTLYRAVPLPLGNSAGYSIVANTDSRSGLKEISYA
jgi:hypothetical protein